MDRHQDDFRHVQGKKDRVHGRAVEPLAGFPLFVDAYVAAHDPDPVHESQKAISDGIQKYAEVLGDFPHTIRFMKTLCNFQLPMQGNIHKPKGGQQGFLLIHPQEIIKLQGQLSRQGLFSLDACNVLIQDHHNIISPRTAM